MASAFEITYSGIPLKGDYGMWTIPGTNTVYLLDSSNLSAVYYANLDISPAANRYFLTGVSDIQDLCIGDATTLYALSVSGPIIQIIVDGAGSPVSQTPMTGSDSIGDKYAFAFDPIASFFVVNVNVTSSYYKFQSGAYTLLTSTAPNLNGYIRFIAGSFYIGTSDTLVQTELVGTTLSVTSSIPFGAGSYPGQFVYEPESDVLYVVLRNSDGFTSIISSITHFALGPRGSPTTFYSSADSPPPNTFWGLTLSTVPSRLLYVANISTPYNFFAIGLPPPCLTSDMQILTPQGYRRVDTLRQGDRIRTPDNRIVRIASIFHTTIERTDKLTAPYIIPKDFVCPNVPSQDVRLSSNHLFFADGSWRLPIWEDTIRQENTGESVTYYHIACDNYGEDKLLCFGLPVDSWDRKTRPLE